ncbi:hypothetical protein ES5_12355 [Dietzia cinnamea P4]|nr:hypothetical protein ES5_12355 [Dietzia cinnamea P4]
MDRDTCRQWERTVEMTTTSSAGEGPSAADLREQGFATRREVMSDALVDRAMDRAVGTASEAIQHVVAENVWGNIWNRPGLDRRDRSLLNIGMLVALRADAEPAGHVRGGLTNGLTREEITEAVIHASEYCGAPAALAATRTVQTVFDDLDG